MRQENQPARKERKIYPARKIYFSREESREKVREKGDVDSGCITRKSTTDRGTYSIPVALFPYRGASRCDSLNRTYYFKIKASKR